MTGKELELILLKLDLSQTAFGDLLGYEPRTVRYWIANQTHVPPPVAVLARLMWTGELTSAQIANAKEPQ